MLIPLPPLWLVVLAVICAAVWPFRARYPKGFSLGEGGPLGTYAWPISGRLWPVFGALPFVSWHFNRYHDMICDVAEEAGDGKSFASSMLGSPPFVYIGANPELIEHVLKTQFWKYEKGEFFKSTLRVFLGSGIFNSDGEVWQKQRKVASHLFTARSLKEDMSAVFLKNATVVIDRVRRYAQESRSFDIQDLFFRYTLDSFAEIAFGCGAGCLSDGAPVPFAVAFDLVQANTSARFFGPAWPLKRLLNVGSERVIREQIVVMRDFANEMIERTRRARETDKSDKPDLLSRYIQYAEQHEQPTPTNEELNDHVLNFIIAGRDTTACLLSWATYELTQHPKLQEQLYAECKDWSTADTSSSIVHGLPLLHAFIMESLRLHPSVPQDTKECVTQDVWPTGEVIEPGTMIAYSPYLMGRSRKLWGPDAAEFKVSRWFEKDGHTPIKEPSQYMMPQFNAGLRLCLGKSVAILESTMMLCGLIQNFKFETKQKNVTYQLTVTLPIKGGFRVEATERQPLVHPTAVTTQA